MGRGFLCFMPVGQVILLPMAAKGETGPPAVIWGHPTDPLLALAAPFLRQPLAVLHLVAQSCPTLYNPMDCSPPGFSVQGDSPGQNTGVGCHALLQGIFLTQGSNPGLLHCRQILYCLSHQGSCIPSNHPGRGLQESESVSLSVMSNSDSVDCRGPSRLLCPWDFPGKNTGVDDISFSRDFPDPGIKSWVSGTAGRFFTF